MEFEERFTYQECVLIRTEIFVYGLMTWFQTPVKNLMYKDLKNIKNSVLRPLYQDLAIKIAYREPDTQNRILKITYWELRIEVTHLKAQRRACVIAQTLSKGPVTLFFLTVFSTCCSSS